MKTKRLINAAIFAAIAIILITYVCFEWNKQGCETESLFAAIGMYGSCLTGVWITIDQTIKESSKR